MIPYLLTGLAISALVTAYDRRFSWGNLAFIPLWGPFAAAYALAAAASVWDMWTWKPR